MSLNILSILTAAFSASALFSISASAETVEGKLNGYDCAHSGITCAIDPKDPHIALEPDFVLQKRDGDYIFLMNVPREVKITHVLKNAQVEGVMSKKFNSMTVDKFKIKDGETWKTVWDKNLIPKINLELVEGRLNGHDCVHAGITCPLDPEDPRILIERDFVLQKEDGDYMFLTNLSRSTKLQYVLQDVLVNGVVDTKYNTIVVHELMVMEDDDWKIVWVKKE